MEISRNEKLKHLNAYNSEAYMKALEPFITPKDAFYIRGRTPAPIVSLESYKLGIKGLVDRPVDLTYENILSMPSVTMAATMECAGNGRGIILPKPPRGGEEWGHGAVGTQIWTGTRLSKLLRSVAAIKEDSIKEIVFKGADTGHKDDNGNAISFERSISKEKVMSGDVILAYSMNFEPLTHEHGFPLRLIVPGHYGMDWVRSVTEILPIDHSFEGFYQKERYVFKSKEGIETPVNAMKVRSIITNIEDGETIGQGSAILSGKAWSGDGLITKVEVSIDEGKNWSQANITAHPRPGLWSKWVFILRTNGAGEMSVMSRAHDSKGNVQPMEPVWNELGYSNNSVQRIKINVRK